jgi:quinoprotein glucose dehydrogenase
MIFRSCLVVALAPLFALAVSNPPRSVPKSGYRDWRVYGGGPESIRYSVLDQINRGNVRKLQVAWTYDTGDVFSESEMQCNPIVIDGVLYASSPKVRVFALDAATGKQIWTFDPNEGSRRVGKQRNRGLTWWQDGSDRRLFFGFRQWLYALDARTGKPVASFGQNGRIDLREGLGRDAQEVSVGLTTPGIIYKDLLIVGSLLPEDLPAPPGDIRAYDVRSGKLRWTFHTIPRPGEFGYETWPKDAWTYAGAANNWAGMALDEKRGLVFVPTGSAAFDFYGSNRTGDNLFANTMLALKAETGERVWHFQAVKHDLWDRDFPAPPNLVTVLRDGKLIDAVAQISKAGFVWLFERDTGKPVYPVEYRKVAPSDVEGEAAAATQPFPLKPPPFARQVLTEDMLTTRTPEAHEAVLQRFRQIRSAGPFVPPSLQGTIVFPGFDGAGEWGGAAFDPASGLLYVNSNEMAWVLRLIERPKSEGRTSGREMYLRNCVTCHRQDLRGTPPEFPSLVGIGDKYTQSELRAIVREGAGRMPGFPHFSREGMAAIVRYIATGKDTSVAPQTAGPYPFGLKYTIDGYNKFLDPDGYPAIEPPWGTLNAIDLDKGEIAWTIPFGEIPALAREGLAKTGSENYGGPVVTAGGVLFIGATNYDRKFRAYDKTTGELLWEHTLPASGNATPATYQVNGRQYVVIAAGGGKWGNSSGGSYVAFALPEEPARPGVR